MSRWQRSRARIRRCCRFPPMSARAWAASPNCSGGRFGAASADHAAHARELGYRQEQRFHLELGLLKMAHAQRLLPIEQWLSEASASRTTGTPPRPTLAPSPVSRSISSPTEARRTEPGVSGDRIRCRRLLLIRLARALPRRRRPANPQRSRAGRPRHTKRQRRHHGIGRSSDCRVANGTGSASGRKKRSQV